MRHGSSARKRLLQYRPLQDYLAERNRNYPSIASFLRALPKKLSCDSQQRFTTASSQPFKQPATMSSRKLTGSKHD